MERINLYLWICEPGYPEALARSLQETDPCFSFRLLEACPDVDDLPAGSLLLTDRIVAARPGLVRLAGLEDAHEAEKPAANDGNPEEQMVAMYQSARQISENLKEIYGRLTGRRLLRQGGGPMKIICFHGVDGGAGCTTLAQAFAQELRRFRGRRVLVLSLEEFPSTDRYYPSAGPAGGLARMLGESGPGPGPRQIPLQIYETGDENGVLAFPAPPGRNPLREMEPEAFTEFIEILWKSGRYDILVADCGAGLDPVLVRLAVLADQTVLVSGEGGHGSGRASRFCETLEHRLAPGQQVSWHRVENRMGAGFWDLDVPENQKTILRIPEEPESIQPACGLIHLSLDKELGRGVRFLADRMPGL